MDIKIDEIVKQVLSEIDAPSRPVQPKTTFVLEETPALTGREVGKTAVLDSQEDYMIKNYVLPEVGPKEILVCVEGCMISPSDVTEFLKERRAAGSSAQGQEGTGIIVKVGSENLQDAKGNVLKVGDKVIAAKKAGFGGVSTYGGRKANTVAPNGWFANYIVLPAGQQVYQVNGLDLGANDYLTKPFHFQELEARIRSLTRRKFIQKDVCLSYGDIRFDTKKREACANGEPVSLTRKENGILEYMLLNQGRPVSQEELIEHVWDASVDSFSGSIRVHVSSLRRKLKAVLSYDPIVNKIGEGYRLERKEK